MGKPGRPRRELWSFAYLAVRRLLSLVLLALRTSGSKEIEILVLRYELEILRRNQPRPCLQPADRAWLATLSWLLPRERWSAFGVRRTTRDPPSLAPSPRRPTLDVPPTSARPTADRR